MSNTKSIRAENLLKIFNDSIESGNTVTMSLAKVLEEIPDYGEFFEPGVWGVADGTIYDIANELKSLNLKIHE